MSEFATDKRHSKAAKIRGIVHVDAVLEGMYLHVRYFIPKYFKGKKRKSRLKYCTASIKYLLRAKY